MKTRSGETHEHWMLHEIWQQVIHLTSHVRQLEKQMSVEFDALKVQAQATVDGIARAVAEIEKLASGVSGTPAAEIVAVTDSLKGASDKLQVAIDAAEAGKPQPPPSPTAVAAREAQAGRDAAAVKEFHQAAKGSFPTFEQVNKEAQAGRDAAARRK